jgi:CheY-like chemotaxis protein
VACALRASCRAEQPPRSGCRSPQKPRSRWAKRRTFAAQASRRARILFVDDDLLIAGSTVALLEDLGHEVIEAHSAREALQLLEAGLDTDLLITDHAMPGMTGSELAFEVRRQRPQLPVLLATGFAELGGDKVVDLPRLGKPYTQAQLAAEIARLLPNVRID